MKKSYFFCVQLLFRKKKNEREIEKEVLEINV